MAQLEDGARNEDRRSSFHAGALRLILLNPDAVLCLVDQPIFPDLADHRCNDHYRYSKDMLRLLLPNVSGSDGAARCGHRLNATI